jgi:hypothetical protein
MTIYVPGKVVLKKESVAADPYYNNVSLLLHGDGANGSTTILDSSPSPKDVEPFGDAQISTAIADPFGNSKGVLAFDGSGDYLSCPDSAAFNMENQDFTIETWFYAIGIGGYQALVTTADPADYQGFFLGIYNTQYTFLVDSLDTGAPWLVDFAGGAFSASTWNHVALVRSGNTFTLYGNGQSLGSQSAAITLGNANNLVRVGGRTIASQYFNGYIDDLRITKGVARYTSNFTPPTAPFPEVLG